MKQTEQYNLNQWELSDRVLMADFNADNSKIASALAALAGKQSGETSRVNAALAKKADLTALSAVQSALEAEDRRLDAAVSAEARRADAALASARGELEAEDRRLDAAKLQYRKIFETSLPNADGTYAADLTGLGLGDHLMLLLEVEGLEDGQWYFYLNRGGDIIEGTKRPVNSAMGPVGKGTSQYLFLPMGNPLNYVWCRHLNGLNIFGQTINETYQSLYGLTIRAQDSSAAMSGRFAIRFYAIG